MAQARPLLSHILPWLLWLAPLLLSILRLRDLGVFDGPMVGSAGSDFYPGMATARLQQTHPGGIPPVLPEFNFPDGMPKTLYPEFFSEPLFPLWLKATLLFTNDPATALWLGMVTSTLFNIWGVWLLLWFRFAKESKLGVLAGWALLALSPWFWTRTTVHWHLSWIPFFLFAILLWWDFFVHGKRPRLPVAIAAHFLLLAQSIYYGVFLMMLVAFWTLTAIPGWIRRRAIPRGALALVLAAAMGYSLTLGWVLTQFGGNPSAFTEARGNTQRSPIDYHIFSSRMRELTKGGPNSPWNRFAVVTMNQKPTQYARDGESFPSPLPKLALFAAIGLLVGTIRRRRELAPDLLKQLGYFQAGMWGFFLVGLQEIPWIRFGLLMHVFPFVRSYARIIMPILCIAAIWIATSWRPLSERYSPRAQAAFAGAWLALIFIDYGWPQQVHGLQRGYPCAELYAVFEKHRLPVFLHQAVKRDEQHCEGASEFDLYARTGLPQTTPPYKSLHTALDRRETGCAEIRARLERAGEVLWWFEGTAEELERSGQCLTPSRIEPVYQPPHRDPKLVLRIARLRVLPRSGT